MNGLELKQRLAQFKEEDLAELTVAIEVAGLSGSHVVVTGAHRGIDWENGLLIMAHKPMLNTVSTREISLYRDLWYAKYSNWNKLWKTPKGQPYVAVYKKETASFERESQAKLWIGERMREDVDKILGK